MNNQLEPGPWLSIHDELGVKPWEFDDRAPGSYVELYAGSIGDKIALQYFERQISYQEYNEQTNRLANALAGLGVGRGDVVGLYLPNIPQGALAVVAISKLGATISAISPLLAPSEVAQQIDDAGIKVVISLDVLANATIKTLDAGAGLPNCLKAVVVTSADDLRQPVELDVPALKSVSCLTYLDITAAADPRFQQVDLRPDHVYLIQYTGGTTGKPKGAMLTLRGTMHNILLSTTWRPLEVGTETIVGSFPMFHIAGLSLILWSLKCGGRLLMIPDMRDMDHFCQQMIDFPPTRLGAVPTLYQMIADHPLCPQIDFSYLRNASTGAAPITGDDRKRIEKMLNGTVLSDSFGMTESGPTIVMNPPERCKPESIGIPCPSVDVRIVDVETGTQELPYGEAGEIIVASPCLMKGYLNRPDETANSLRQWHGKTWMHTGDVGVMDEEGYLYIKDRAKDMIIVSGFKVFSVEVEDKLSSLEFIAASALIGTPDDGRPGSEIVNLYVQLTAEASGLDPDQVREDILAFCRAEMAPYKVPKVIHFIDAIPLTPVGKVDKKVLRASARGE